MSPCYDPSRAAARAFLALAVMALLVAHCPTLQAQQQVTGINTRAVGGVLMDAAGMVRNATVDELGRMRDELAQVLNDVPEGLDRSNGMLKVSLRRLDEAIRGYLEDGQPIPAEIACLGGLQQIHYVLVYPEQNDIVLVGPAEGWKIDARGAVVGAANGRPVLLLDDLIVALRSAAAPTRSVISCSIDPTPEGMQRIQALARSLRANSDPQMTAMVVARQLGPQQVSVTGVPQTSHFAGVMVAADYHMKRIGMGTQPAPIRGLPPFTQSVRGSRRGMSNMLPRWWLAPNYEPLLRDADGLAWELRGASVKAMTESDFFDATGTRQESRRADPASQKWADTLTERYDDLALAEPVFGQLRNCMDLAIAAAIIVGDNLTQKAQVELPMLMGSSGPEPAVLAAPKQVESKATVGKKGRNWVIACGGVQLNPWEMVAGAQLTDKLAAVRQDAAVNAPSGQWWE